MDIFDILEAIKIEFMCKGMDEKGARRKAEFIVSNGFHVSLYDIERLYYNSGLYNNRYIDE